MWLKAIIPAAQEADIRRIRVQSQPQANRSQDPISEKRERRRSCNDGFLAKGTVFPSVFPKRRHFLTCVQGTWSGDLHARLTPHLIPDAGAEGTQVLGSSPASAGGGDGPHAGLLAREDARPPGL
jgi:hypothetical protein